MCFFLIRNYPLILVDNPKLRKYRRKDEYTFEEVYKEFAKSKFLTDEEIILAREKNIKVKGKYSYHYPVQVKAVYKYTLPIRDIKYKKLLRQDFQGIINDVNKKVSVNYIRGKIKHKKRKIPQFMLKLNYPQKINKRKEVSYE